MNYYTGMNVSALTSPIAAGFAVRVEDDWYAAGRCLQEGVQPLNQNKRDTVICATGLSFQHAVKQHRAVDEVIERPQRQLVARHGVPRALVV